MSFVVVVVVAVVIVSLFHLFIYLFIHSLYLLFTVRAQSRMYTDDTHLTC